MVETQEQPLLQRRARRSLSLSGTPVQPSPKRPQLPPSPSALPPCPGWPLGGSLGTIFRQKAVRPQESTKWWAETRASLYSPSVVPVSSCLAPGPAMVVARGLSSTPGSPTFPHVPQPSPGLWRLPSTRFTARKTDAFRGHLAGRWLPTHNHAQVYFRLGSTTAQLMVGEVKGPQRTGRAFLPKS